MKSRAFARVYWAIAGPLFLVPATCHAQMIQLGDGVITDSGGSVVLGAGITITNTSTGIATKADTNNVGLYRVSGLFLVYIGKT